MRQINPNGFQSLCHSMYDDYFVVIKIFDFDFDFESSAKASTSGIMTVCGQWTNTGA